MHLTWGSVDHGILDISQGHSHSGKIRKRGLDSYAFPRQPVKGKGAWHGPAVISASDNLGSLSIFPGGLQSWSTALAKPGDHERICFLAGSV
ncbi:uncharacterized protein BDCG_17496 [Blastomyces dermatitidis ER-3]|uniref:Uncharacterized protein n=2 Tax=Blastomyces TaxID=229219 RepID=A0A179UV66_BLAGS|nr:uncharacterized protein BDBG_17557 [Blastomyces gilchristii SLH14081]XP_045282084.1 uncharacterized protein BDCG_17496 [Blastomyces dermatitidis ER-3]EQL36368.1 hypothetical protein BDFG_02102 [Blastomyces dermatitidis ATCC 26199]OAT02357.1 hypothetical protein BDCG_17496 [Blastomyces dermatitidis ER-3]OAT11720.1 hypothetical protein BDBG_17557 [Blastomyces gilchristii SLH14081]